MAKRKFGGYVYIAGRKPKPITRKQASLLKKAFPYGWTTVKRKKANA